MVYVPEPEASSERIATVVRLFGGLRPGRGHFAPFRVAKREPSRPVDFTINTLAPLVFAPRRGRARISCQATTARGPCLAWKVIGADYCARHGGGRPTGASDVDG